MAERWSSVEEVSEHLGIADDTVYRWIAGGRLPAHRIGRHWKFKLTEVDAWVREGHTVERGNARDRGPASHRGPTRRRQPAGMAR